jgi:hypothetical protein
VIIPVGPWLPDLPDLGNPGSTVATNVIPASPKDYGPCPSLVNVIATALNARVQGAATYEDDANLAYVLAGTVSKLYILIGGASSFADVSGQVFVTDPAQFWNFAQYQNRVMATNFQAPIQSYVLGASSTFAQLSAGAPQARYMDMVKVFLMAANTYDPVGLGLPQRVWWSAAGDPTTWPTPGSNAAQQVQSSYVDLVGDMGAITGVVGNIGNADAAIFFQRGVWTAQYAGPPTVFNFTPAEGAKGCAAPASIVRYGAVVYYLGVDGFYMFDGANSSPIGVNKVDNWFFRNASSGYQSQMNGAANIAGKCIIWSFPTSSAPAGQNDACLIYHTVFGNWSLAFLPFDTVIRTLTLGAGLDSLGTLFGYTNIDTMPVSLDSSLFFGGSLQFGGFDTSHKFGSLQGVPLAATVTTTEAQPTPGRRSFLRSVRPLIDGAPSSVALLGRNREFDLPVQMALAAPNAMGECPMRADARFMRFQINTAAGQVFNHIHGVDVDAVASGWR